jgi:hypothetical protein
MGACSQLPVDGVESLHSEPKSRFKPLYAEVRSGQTSVHCVHGIDNPRVVACASKDCQ